MMKFRVPTTMLALALLPFTATAQDLGDFLAPLLEHPGLAASTAQLRTEEARLASARDPLNLSVTYGYNAFQLSDDAANLPPGTLPPGSEIPDSASQLSVDLSLRPVRFGDIRDLYDQSQLQLAMAELSWRQALTGLQVNAVKAAYSLDLAEESLALAEEGLALARQAGEATEVRFDNGAANERELRDSREAVVEAETLAASARAGVELARSALQSLVGDQAAPPREQLNLAIPEGEAASVQNAALQAELARVGARNARRTVLPVVQAGYTYNIDDHNSVGVSLESRTLQPNLNYTYQSTARTMPQSMIDGSFTIGVSASISPAVGAALKAADAQELAADEGLAAARQQAEIEHQRLLNDLEQARLQLDLADLVHRNASANLEETRTREELGLAIPLETQQAVLELMRAELELGQARQAQLESTLALFEFTAQPIVEVEPQ